MTRVAFWLLIISMSASAQVPGLPTRASGASSSSGVSDCAALDGGVCTTTAAMTLYVDPTGSDSNACTASGTSACLTLAGALTRVPRFVRHNVTVNIAAGTYAEGAAVNDFTISRNVTLALTGVWAPATVATGAATGTVTGYTITSSTNAAVVTDSTQSWTTDDLRFKFFRITSGALSGTAYPIVRNTGTTVTVPTVSSGALVGATYELVTHGSIFSSASASFAFSTITGGGTLEFSTLRMDKASTTQLWGPATASTSGGGIKLTECDLHSTGSAAVVTSDNSYYQINRSLFRGDGTSSQVATVVVGGPARILAQSSLVVATGTGGALSLGGTGPLNSWINCYFEGGTASVNPVVAVSTASVGVYGLLSFSVVSCAGQARTGIAISTNLFGGRLSATNLFITSCTTGLDATGISVYVSALGIADTTTGVVVGTAGRLSLANAVPTFTGVTNELQVDGVNYPYSFLSGLSPSVIIGPYGSALFK